MRILIHSDLPVTNSGYGSQVSQLASRLLDDGHDVGWKTVFDTELDELWGCPVFSSTNSETFGWDSMAESYDEFDADVLFTLSDHWSTTEEIQEFLDGGYNAIFYTVVDSLNNLGQPPRRLKVLCHENAEVVTMSKWAANAWLQFEEADDVNYIPHCVDTSVYRPGDSHREGLGCTEDDFLVSFVGDNQIRKNVTNILDGFDKFQSRPDVGDDVHFYFHTEPSSSEGFDLRVMAEGMDFEKEKVHTPDNVPNRAEVYDDEFILNVYRASDVYLHPTGGESWGMTVTEAMSCDTPVIVNNYGPMTEQVTGDHTVQLDEHETYQVEDYGTLVNRGSPLWRDWKGSKYYRPRPEHIADALHAHYKDEVEHTGDMSPRKSVVKRYDADTVYHLHWKPFFENLDI